jgi:outer membrane murein-binding lipoprotein Lpp
MDDEWTEAVWRKADELAAAIEALNARVAFLEDEAERDKLEPCQSAQANRTT